MLPTLARKAWAGTSFGQPCAARQCLCRCAPSCEQLFRCDPCCSSGKRQCCRVPTGRFYCLAVCRRHHPFDHCVVHRQRCPWRVWSEIAVLVRVQPHVLAPSFLFKTCASVSPSSLFASIFRALAHCCGACGWSSQNVS